MSYDDIAECPLCMETLDIDDLNFYPCTCGYQICRFCWHRIRTGDNALCPACRKQYQEDPAQFQPLTEDDLTNIKKERRQKDAARKQKAAENRKHLANIRVVQKNLVFVVGLTKQLADPDVMRRHEHFGKFGKIMKVVINNSTSYAGAQGPSASAYITFTKPEDCLKAIQAVNNLNVDGRTLKASLGTTKYCSNFLKGTPCHKTDCMYLHELGEQDASFTKDEMQAGLHQEYEQRLGDMYLNPPVTHNSIQHTSEPLSNKQSTQPTHHRTTSNGSGRVKNDSTSSSGKEAWPLLKNTNNGGTTAGSPNTTEPDTSQTQHMVATTQQLTTSDKTTHSHTQHQHRHSVSESSSISEPDPGLSEPQSTTNTQHTVSQSTIHTQHNVMKPQHSPTEFDIQPQQPPQHVTQTTTNNVLEQLQMNKPSTPLPVETEETLSHSGSTNWPVDWPLSGSFNTSMSAPQADDELDFDPFAESTRGLADMLQSEGVSDTPPLLHPLASLLRLPVHTTPPPGIPTTNVLQNNVVVPPPPGLSGVSGVAPSQFGGLTSQNNAMSDMGMGGMPPIRSGSRILGLIQPPASPHTFNNTPPPSFNIFSHDQMRNQQHNQNTNNHVYNFNPITNGIKPESTLDFESLKAVLPHASIKVASASHHQNAAAPPAGMSRLRTAYMSHPPQSPTNTLPPQTQPNHMFWNGHTSNSKSSGFDSLEFSDPAIVSGVLSSDIQLHQHSGSSISPPTSTQQWFRTIPQQQQQPFNMDSDMMKQNLHNNSSQMPSLHSHNMNHTQSQPPFGFPRSGQPHSRMPFVQNNTNGWTSIPTHNPPPGFPQSFRNPTQNTHMTPLES